jgi:hypothetical protein
MIIYINGRGMNAPELKAYISELEAENAELRAKVESAERQKAEYKRLLKEAVEDFETIESNLEYDEHCVIKTHSIRCDECPLSADTIYRCKWRHADEALKLIEG